MTNIFEATVPFAGFYGVHDESLSDFFAHEFLNDALNVDGCVERLLDEIDGGVDWKQVYNDYAKSYVKALSEELDLPLVFDKLCSPREYNFSTDRILCSLSQAGLTQLSSRIDPVKFAIKVKDDFTSRSGFSSYYSSDAGSWGAIETWDHNQIGCAIASLLDDWTFKNELDLMEDYRCNGFFAEWIYNATSQEGRKAMDKLHALQES